MPKHDTTKELAKLAAVLMAKKSGFSIPARSHGQAYDRIPAYSIVFDRIRPYNQRDQETGSSSTGII